MNTNGQAEGFVNFCASCRGHCKLLKNFEPSPLSVSLNWAIIPDKLGSSVPHIMENTTTDSMQYDNEKVRSGNHYSTKLNHKIWNPVNNNSKSGNPTIFLAMLGSNQTFNDNSESKNRPVTLAMLDSSQTFKRKSRSLCIKAVG